MLQLIADLILSYMAIGLLAVVCYAWGRMTFRTLGVPSSNSVDCADLLIGFSVISASIAFLHLFMPVDWRMGLLFLGLSLLWLVCDRKQIHQLATDVKKFSKSKPKFLFTTLTVVIALIWCLRSMGLPNNFDSGLYHFGSIRWLNEYPIIPGLGNVHWRLALNQSYFGYLSIVNFFPFWNKGYAVGGLFLTYLTALTIFEYARKQKSAWKWICGGVLFIFLGYLAGTLPNPSPDTAVGLIEIAIFIFLFRILSNRETEGSNNLRNAIVVTLLSLTLVTIKLSSIAFALASICIVCWDQLLNLSKSGFVYLKLFLLVVFIAVIHFLRGYLLSGAPLFPSTFAGAWHLDWAIPLELVQSEVNLIYSWGRQPGEMLANQVLGHWNWIGSWLKTIPILDWTMFSLASILTPANVYRCLTRSVSKPFYPYLILYVPVVSAFAFWFFTAPDVRFLGAVPALYAGLSLWLFYVLFIEPRTEWRRIKSQEFRTWHWTLMIAICLFSLKLTGLRSLSLTGWTPVPSESVEIQQTLTKLPVYVAQSNGQCWNASLPCASIFNGNLHADPWLLPWPLSIFIKDRFFYSVKFLNLPR